MCLCAPPLCALFFMHAGSSSRVCALRCACRVIISVRLISRAVWSAPSRARWIDRSADQHHFFVHIFLVPCAALHVCVCLFVCVLGPVVVSHDSACCALPTHTRVRWATRNVDGHRGGPAMHLEKSLGFHVRAWGSRRACGGVCSAAAVQRPSERLPASTTSAGQRPEHKTLCAAARCAPHADVLQHAVTRRSL